MQASRTNALEHVVLHIGREGFGQALIAYADELAGVDHCMVFAFRSKARVDCLMAEGRIERRLAEDLGANYAGRFHENDPNKETIYDAPPGTAVYLPFAAPGAYTRPYRKLFFESSRIVDKRAQVLWDGDSCYYVNFYRLDRSGPFSSAQSRRLGLAGRMLAATVARHFSMASASATTTHTLTTSFEALVDIEPLACLSPRERAVCAGILVGCSSEAIAGRLDISVNTVLTYRRRAYAALGICSQAELFSLALNAVAQRNARP